jgi:hypothetical protein
MQLVHLGTSMLGWNTHMHAYNNLTQTQGASCVGCSPNRNASNLVGVHMQMSHWEALKPVDDRCLTQVTLPLYPYP